MYKYISDLHFGSREIITRCNRPFESVTGMNDILVQNINENTDTNDILIILGDVAIYGYVPYKELRAIHCKKVLIIGNHDRSLLSHYSFRKEFVDIQEQELLNDGENRLFLSHYPHAEWDGFYKNRFHFYGHIHNSAQGAASIMSLYPNAINVCADHLGFVPKTATELITERAENFQFPDCTMQEFLKRVIPFQKISE